MNPCKKRRYSDESDARAGALIALEKQGIYILYVYQCPICNGWHLTRNDNERRYRIVSDDAPTWIK